MSITPLVQPPTCPTCGHDDTRTVKKRDNRWYCYRCSHYVTSADDAPKNNAPIKDEFIEAAHRRLCASEEALAWLENERAIPMSVVKSQRLGLDGHMILIPIPGDGVWVNVRTANMQTGMKKPLDKGRGVQLYPGVMPKTDEVLICEGELDRLVAVGLGFEACTGVGGAAVFHDTWATEIASKVERAVIVYDCDRAGRAGARIVAGRLIEAGLPSSRIKSVHLPLEFKSTSGPDLTDWAKAGGTADQLRALIDATDPWEQHERRVAEVPTEAPRRTLSEASHKDNARDWSTFECSVIALHNDSYQLPTKISIDCTEDQGPKMCGVCALPVEKERVPPGQAPVIDLDTTTDLYVEHIGAPKKNLRQQILGSVGIPGKCPSAVIDELATIPVQEGRIGEPLRIDAERRASDRLAIFIDLEDTIEPNKEYEVMAKFLPHPQDQVITAIVHRATGVDQFVEHFKEKPKLIKKLGAGKLGDKVSRLLRDASEVTRIRGREDMHLMVLLSRLSTLYLDTGESDKPERGWLDVAIIGDTAEGKSEVMSKLNEWTELGNVIALKKATTRAGLLGGVISDRGKTTISWGVYPRHDRRWLGLDEFHSSHPDLISALTDARSSGTAQVYMANVTANTSCRVRVCWGANPRSEMPVSAHAYGYDTVEQAFKRLEDIRRLDAAMIVAKGEVDAAARDQKPRAIEAWTREVARHLELRAWAQRGVDVRHLLDPARSLVVDFESEYDGVSPLVEPNALRLKLVRLAVALANLVAEKPGVKHLKYVAAWLHSIYGSDTMGLRTLAQLERSRRTLANRDQVVNTLRMTGDLHGVAEALLMQPDWSVIDLRSLASDSGVAQHFVAILVRNRALVRQGNTYRKTPAMVALLKEVLQSCP